MSILSYVKRHVFAVSIVAVIVIFLAIIGGRAAKNTGTTEVSTTAERANLVKVSSFRNGSVNISANGVVESFSQADLRSQVSAPVAIVYSSIGSTVYAGQAILELSNADIRAQLAQMEAALATAKGQKYIGAVSLDSAKQSLVEKIRDSYIKSFDVFNSQLYPILYNNDGNRGRLEQYISDYKLLGEIISNQIDIDNALRGWKKTVDTISFSSSKEELSKAVLESQKNLDMLDKLLGNVSQVLNDAAKYSTPEFTTSLNVWKATVTAARTTISGSAQALTASNMAYETSLASQNTTAESGVSAAEAGVNNLRAQLAKTVVISPITGKISSLPLREGELATPGTLLATVIGDSNRLEIKAYVSSDDLYRLRIGQPVLIQEKIKGKVSNIAPSVDTSTKKAEIRIGIDDSWTSGLVIGENVNVSITAENVLTTNSLVKYVLPIQNVKIVPGSAYVFTVDADSKIKRNDVVLGKIQGDFVEVISGLDDSMSIITPVYGLDEGQVINIQ